MAIVNITIDGRKLQAQAGQTLLQAAKAAGIDIPTLCEHPALAPYGACRLCLVEIERQRTLQPACTFPITEGMVAYTESEKVVAARKFVLEMLFSERIHYCMFCPVSAGEGKTDCELQRAAYRYGLDSWRYAPNYQKKWPVDASRKYFLMDHSRCILCRRCVRACDDIVANHTLGLRERGAKTLVVADGGLPFGASSCVSCGTCLQVCPTGALIDRRSAFQGHETDVERTKTACLACPVGCGVEAITRYNRLLRVEGDWDANNGGLLCVHGRFEVMDPTPPRVETPLIKKGGKWAKATWDEALALVNKRFSAAHKVAGLASPRATNEELAAFHRLFQEAWKSDEVGLLYGEVPPLDLGAAATLPDVANADCVVVVGGDPLEHQKVAGYLAKRALDNEAALIVVEDKSTELACRAMLTLPVRRIGKIKLEVEKADRPVVLYAAGLSETVYAHLRKLPTKVKFMPLVKGTNAIGAAKIGLKPRQVKGDALFVLAGDEVLADGTLPEARFIVIQAAYKTAALDNADVVLPALAWSEKDGHVVNVEGRVLAVVPVLQSPENVPADDVTLRRLLHD